MAMGSGDIQAPKSAYQRSIGNRTEILGLANFDGDGAQRSIGNGLAAG